jgi:hypothetical protein
MVLSVLMAKRIIALFLPLTGLFKGLNIVELR